jgi:diphosphate-dependent phosphofructokinase
LIANVCLDALSSGKYYHFIRLMGRAASNITLECALQTHPNITLLGEEVAARKQNLASITQEIVNVIVDRANTGKHHGVILVPEGLIEFVPEMGSLLKEINELLSHGTEATMEAVGDSLSANNAALFRYLPVSIRKQLLAERDPHGNVQVSLIETEKLLAETVQHELERLRRAHLYSGNFTYQCMFFGYEARAGMPSDFDTAYCYSLGYNAAALIHAKQTGVISSVTNLDKPIEQWTCGGVPLTSMMNIERRHGKDKPVIKKYLVELHAAPFRTFAANRHRWALHDCYRSPGPVQLDLSGQQVRADGTHVDPLCFTLLLDLQERAKNNGQPVNPPSHGISDVAKYAAVAESLLRSSEPVTAQDVHKLLLYRLSHSISDADHLSVLNSLHISEEEWNKLLEKERKGL